MAERYAEAVLIILVMTIGFLNIADRLIQTPLGKETQWLTIGTSILVSIVLMNRAFGEKTRFNEIMFAVLIFLALVAVTKFYPIVPPLFSVFG